MEIIKGEKEEVKVLETGEVCKVDIVEKWAEGVYVPPDGLTRDWLWICFDKPRLDIKKGSAVEWEGETFHVLAHENGGKTLYIDRTLRPEERTPQRAEYELKKIRAVNIARMAMQFRGDGKHLWEIMPIPEGVEIPYHYDYKDSRCPK